MIRVKHLDYFLLFVVTLFLLLGVSFLATISAPLSLNRFGTTNFYLIHQLTYGLLPGVILGFLAFIVPLSFIRRISPLLLLGILISFLLIFLPHSGGNFWGASRWVSFWFINFQPAEFFKIVSILYLSSWLRNRLGGPTRGAGILKDKMSHNSFKNIFLPFIVFLGFATFAFYLQRDITTLGIICLTALVIYFIAGTPKWHTLLIVSGALVLLVGLVVFEPYRATRFTSFLHPDIDPQGASFQINQSLIAIGSGGLAGRGLGMSNQKFGFLPQSMSDSTFAIFAEETGFLGCSILIFLYLAFLWLGFMIARHSTDKFNQLVAWGITFWILLQGFVNISSTIGIWPVSGIPLPFIAYGGSHIVAELVAVGILLNIARQIKR
ncbi:MAG: putative peptidoglycan glycosyltransferase FtsW [Candidatus Staskawiczbacteria bacterium]|jgi:cell division protein FtsW